MRITMLAIAPLLVLSLALLGACGEKKTTEGPGGKELSVRGPTDQSLQQGESEVIKISVDRDGFTGPIDLSISELPQGVDIEGEKSIPAGSDSRELTIMASDTAAIVNDHRVTITAKAEGLSPVPVTFLLDVEQKEQ